MPSLRARLLSNVKGAAAIEFALLAPIFATLAVGVFQAGLHVQKYNAIRNLATDVSRYAMVEYQKGNTPTATEIENQIQTLADSGGYLLDSTKLVETVTQETTSGIAGTFQMTIDLQYTPENLLQWIPGTDMSLSYSRPVFLIDESGASTSTTTTGSSTSGSTTSTGSTSSTTGGSTTGSTTSTTGGSTTGSSTTSGSSTSGSSTSSSGGSDCPPGQAKKGKC